MTPVLGPKAMSTVRESKLATIGDLYRTPAKAELIDGTWQLVAPTGFSAGYAAGKVFVQLCLYAREHDGGLGNRRHVVSLPHRQSFSPDAASWTGQNPGMKFRQGAPVFAKAVRNEGRLRASRRAGDGGKACRLFRLRDLSGVGHRFTR